MSTTYVIYRWYVKDPKTQKELSYVGYKGFKGMSWIGNPDFISGHNGELYLRRGSNKFGPVKSKMAAAIQKYGWANFKFQVLDQVSTSEDAIDLKWKYIQQFNSIAEGLNIHKGKGQGPIENIPVEQYSKDGVFIAEYSSLSEAAKATGCYVGSIGSVINGGKYKSTGGYAWKRKKI